MTPPPTMAAQEPDYNDFEMITSPKVLLPVPTDGAPMSTGPQFRGSGDNSLPEHVERPPSNPLPQPQPTHSHSVPSQPPSSQDQLEWEVPAKGVEGSSSSDDYKSSSGWKGKGKGKGKRRYAAAAAGCCGCWGCWGLSRKWKWVIGVATTVVILAILAGGIAGGLMNRIHSHPSSSYSLEYMHPRRDAQEATRLAALNWTADGGGANETRHAVFYQVQGALFLSQYYADNSSWVSHNISADFAPQNLNTPSVKPATPLAAAATPSTRSADTAFAAVLYYLNSDNEIRELVSRDGNDLSSWAYGEDHPSRSSGVANWTQLAAAPDFCESDPDSTTSNASCRNAFCYAYQNRDQNVMFACGDNWDEPTQLDSAHPGGALALVPFVSEQQQGGGSDNATAILAREMQLFHYTDTTVKLFHVWSNSSWDAEDKAIISSLEQDTRISNSNPYGYYPNSNANLPQVLASPAHSEADTSMFALGVTGSSSPPYLNLKGSWYNGTTSTWETRDQAVTLVGGSSNASVASDDKAGMAMDHAGYFYAAAYTDWVVFQYAWGGAEEPFVLTYVADIDIWEPCLGEEFDGCG